MPNYTAEQISQTNPDRTSIGTDYQDCALIAQTFERMCHSTPNEAATYATLSRSVQNTKQMSLTIRDSLSSYIRSPKTDTEDRLGEEATSDNALQALSVGTQSTGTLSGEGFGDDVLDWLKDCIPCQLRVISHLELFPRLDLLGALETNLKEKLKQLMDLGRSLTSFNEYSDLCELLKLLNFMCIPDLQRLIVLLMALMILEVGQLDALIGFLQGLISPIFAPILMGLTSLLDQLEQLVVAPVQCIIDAINEQMDKLGMQKIPPPDFSQVTSGFQELNAQVIEAKQLIQTKVDFYTNQVKKLLGEISFGDGAYLQISFKKIKIIRLVALIVGLISALTRGQIICKEQGKDPEKAAMDSFFSTFLNPNQPFELYIDDNGDIQVQEKMDGFADVVQPANQAEPLSNIGNVFQFDGADLVSLPADVYVAVAETASILTQPAKITVRCNIKTTAEDTDQINKWMQELDQL